MKKRRLECIREADESDQNQAPDHDVKDDVYKENNGANDVESSEAILIGY